MVYSKEKKCLLQKFFIIVGLLFVPFFIILKNDNAFAATPINSILASQSTFSKNFQSTVYTQTLNTQSLPAQVLGADANMTGFWHYRLNYVFSNPVTNHSGTGYNHTVYFTLYSNYNLVNADLNRLMGNVKVSFEGIPINQNYCTSGYDITSLTNNSVRFRVTSSCPYNSFSSNQNFQNVQVVVDYTPDSLFWCANDSSKVCPTGVPYIYLSNVDYNFELLTDVQDSYNQTIINQNQTIINQNQDFYNHEYQAEDNISNQSTSDISNASNSQTTSIIGTISSFVTALGTINAGSCDLTLPFPSFIGGDQLVNPCSGKEKAPTIVTIGSSMFLIGIFIPFAFIVLKMIYNEIRSFTNG